MGTRISMVKYDKLNQVQNEAGLRQGATPAATKLFEAGMIEVLREIAVAKLLEFDDETRPDYPQEYNALVEEQSEIYRKIRNELPENCKLTDELDDVTGQINMYESDYSFINGFIEGYKFLRSTYSSYGNISIR